MTGCNITPDEQFWVDHFTFLERRGYRLRCRYNPAHIPARQQGKKPWWLPQQFYRPEDELENMVRSLYARQLQSSDIVAVTLCTGRSPIERRQAGRYSQSRNMEGRDTCLPATGKTSERFSKSTCSAPRHNTPTRHRQRRIFGSTLPSRVLRSPFFEN